MSILSWVVYFIGFAMSIYGVISPFFFWEAKEKFPYIVMSFIVLVLGLVLANHTLPDTQGFLPEFLQPLTLLF